MKLKLPTFAQNNSRPMNQTINIYNTFDTSQITQINNKLERIMATLQELTDKLNELQIALDNEQAQVTAAIQGLESQIAILNDQIANGATPEQLTAVVEQIEAIKNDLSNTIPDVGSETPVEPQA